MFKAGDQVVFAKDDYTSKRYSTNHYMRSHMATGKVMTVKTDQELDHRVLVKDEISSRGFYVYDARDLEYAIHRTKDEELLENLLRGGVS